MRTNTKRIVVGLIAFLAVLIGVVCYISYPQISNLKSEYTTASVIRDLDAYVDKHPGEWPKSWNDLGDGSDRSALTKFRFDLSVEAVLHQPELMYSAVTPVRGKYLTYPHAKQQLDEVFQKIKAKHL